MPPESFAGLAIRGDAPFTSDFAPFTEERAPRACNLT
jgi:transketolase C-terminal domain/subunit